VLFAWSAQTDLDLAGDGARLRGRGPSPGPGAELRDGRYDAHQAAMARYSAVGFEAAAVTGLAVASSTRTSARASAEPPPCASRTPFAAALDDPRARSVRIVPSA
jgi:hypothetical protein